MRIKTKEYYLSLVEDLETDGNPEMSMVSVDEDSMGKPDDSSVSSSSSEESDADSAPFLENIVVMHEELEPRKKTIKRVKLASFVQEGLRTGKINRHDVVSGRGSGVSTHDGNKQYLRWAREFHPLWATADRSNRRAMVEEVLGKVRDAGGSFLVYDARMGEFSSMPVEKAREKCAQAIREHRAK